MGPAAAVPDSSRATCAQLPKLGVGLGYRVALHDEIMQGVGELDFLEVMTEDFLDGDSERQLEEIGRRYPWVPHGTRLSIGSEAPSNERYVAALARFLQRHDVAWYSDHLSFTTAGTLDTGQLLSLWFTEETLAAVVDRIRRLRERISTPLLLENVSYYLALPGSNMTEAEFITRVLYEADCGLLLDLSNLHVNAFNHGYDPIEFLEAIPLERIVQVHLGGSRPMYGLLVDSHSGPVAAEVWPLLRHVLRAGTVKAVSLEWDVEIPPYPLVAEELRRIREVWASA